MRDAATRALWLGALFLLAWTPSGAQQTPPPQNVLDIRDEFEVARAMDVYATSIVRREIDKLMSVFADDAVIVSKAGKGMVSKGEFRKEMEQGTIQRLLIAEVELRVESPRTATVAGTERYTSGGERRSERLLWRLEKRGDQWLIVEVRPVKR